MNYGLPSGYTSWTTTATTSSTIHITYVGSVASNTSVTNNSGYTSDALPLNPPSIEANPGWIAPNGDYYPVNYIRFQRHGQIARAIIRDLLNIDDFLIEEQNYLLDRGWIRVDYDEILPRDTTTTRQQRDTLRKIAAIDSDIEWEKARNLIKSITFKQSRKSNKKAVA